MRRLFDDDINILTMNQKNDYDAEHVGVSNHLHWTRGRVPMSDLVGPKIQD